MDSSAFVIAFRGRTSATQPFLILRDLFLGELGHVVSMIPGAIPFRRPFQCGFDSPPALPSELDTRLAGIQPENLILMYAGNGIANPGRAVAPHAHEFGSDAFDRPDVLIAGSEVVCGSKTRRLGEEFLRQHEVAVQRIEHVLPRTDGVGPPDQNGLIRSESADQIWNKPVLGPITSADDIAGARRGQAYMVFLQPL